MEEAVHASTVLPRDSEEWKPQCMVGTGTAPLGAGHGEKARGARSGGTEVEQEAPAAFRALGNGWLWVCDRESKPGHFQVTPFTQNRGQCPCSEPA